MLRGLHKLCDSADWDGVKRALTDPKNREYCTSVHGRDDWTPLHLACKKNPPHDVLLALIAAGPGATEHFDAQQRLPIHYAAENRVSIHVLTSLCEAYPSSVCEADKDGKTPLHLLITSTLKSAQKPPSRSEIEILLDDQGHVASTVDSSGDFPLHCACRDIGNYSEEILRVLVRAYIPSVLEGDATAKTPLQVALLTSKNEKSLSVGKIRILMPVEEVIRVKDIEGRLPLHCACMNLPSFEVMREIITQYPEGASHQSSDGYYPLEIIEQNRESALTENDLTLFDKMSDTIFVNYPDIEPFDSEIARIERLRILICREINQFQCLGSTASLAWKWMCKISVDPDNIYSTTMKNITKTLSHSMVEALSKMKTSEGKIMDIASVMCTQLLQSRLRFAGKYEFELGQHIVRPTDASYTIQAKEFFTTKKGEQQRDVVIKFFSNRESYDREVDLHSLIKKHNGCDNSVLPILRAYNISRVGTDREVSGDRMFNRDIFDKETYNLGRYCCALVLPQSGPEFKIRLETERYDMGKIKKHIREIGHVMQVLYSNGLSLGEINGKSFVTFDDRLLLPDLTKVKESEKQFYGSEFRSGMLPPEMIATLDSDDVKKYEAYWKPVIDDAKVVKLLLPDDIQMISDNVDAFLSRRKVAKNSLNTQARFSCLWDRITRNSHLWKRIKPQNSDGMHCVIKCCQMDEMTSVPYTPNKLPYDLIPASVSVDIWCYAAYTYELCSGEPLFPRHLTNGDDYKRIATWDIDSEYATMKMERVDDPLARDLLKKLLCNREERPTLLEYILEHPYFSAPEAGDNGLREMSDDIIKSEEFLVRHKQWVKSHTIRPSTISSGLLSRLENSTWSQWEEICGTVDQESIFPTSFVILPYELTASPCGEVQLSKEGGELANKFASFLTKIIQSITLVQEYANSIPQNKHEPDQKLSEYSELNRSKLPACEDNAVDICVGIVTRELNAKMILHDMLNGMVTNPSSVSQSIVDGILEQIVDIALCRDMALKLDHANKVYSEAMETSSSEKETFLEGVKRKYELSLGSEFCSQCVCYKEDVDAALSALIQAFNEDPQWALMQLLKSTMNEFLQFMFSCGKLHFYLIDEMTWSPLISEFYPQDMVPSVEVLEALLPSMYVCLKAMCSTGAHSGLSSMLGMPDSGESPGLEKSQKFEIGHFKNNFALFYDCLIQCLSSETQVESKPRTECEVLHQFENILRSLDPDKNYARMYRICSPDGLTLWTLQDRNFWMKRADHNVPKHYLNEIGREVKDVNDKVVKVQNDNCVNACGTSKTMQLLESITISYPSEVRALTKLELRHEVELSGMIINTADEVLMNPSEMVNEKRELASLLGTKISPSSSSLKKMRIELESNIKRKQEEIKGETKALELNPTPRIIEKCVYSSSIYDDVEEGDTEFHEKGLEISEVTKPGWREKMGKLYPSNRPTSSIKPPLDITVSQKEPTPLPPRALLRGRTSNRRRQGQDPSLSSSHAKSPGFTIRAQSPGPSDRSRRDKSPAPMRAQSPLRPRRRGSLASPIRAQSPHPQTQKRRVSKVSANDLLAFQKIASKIAVLQDPTYPNENRTPNDMMNGI